MMYQSDEISFPNRIRFHGVKGFPLVERFDSVLMRLASNGLLEKWDKDSTFKIIKIESDPLNEPLSLGHLQGAFFVWAFGMIAATIALIGERIAGHFKCCKPKEDFEY